MRLGAPRRSFTLVSSLYPTSSGYGAAELSAAAPDSLAFPGVERETRSAGTATVPMKGESMMRIRLVGLLAAASVLLGAGAAQAATTVQELQYSSITELCNGDPVQLSGTLLFVDSFTTLPSGGHASMVLFEAQNVTGVDLVTGTTYHLASTLSGRGVLSSAGGSTGTFISRFHLQSTGGAESFTVGLTAHTTVAPDGTYVVVFEKPIIAC